MYIQFYLRQNDLQTAILYFYKTYCTVRVFIFILSEILCFESWQIAHARGTQM